MTLQSTPAYARILSHPEVTLRNVHQAMFGGRTGAIKYGDFVVAPTGTSRQFSIGAGRAYLHGLENAQQGGYVAWNDATENQLVAAPAASPVIDTVLLRIYDEQYGTLPSGTSRAQWDIIRGTPNASPVALPDSAFMAAGAQYVPGAWWRLCDIRTNPGDTTIPSGQIYPSNLFARIAGHTIGTSYASTTGFGGFPSGAVLGDTFYAVDLKRHHEWEGSYWIQKGYPGDATVATSETYGSTTFGDMATNGPGVFIYTGAAAKVTITAKMKCSVADSVYAGFQISGNTTQAATTARSIHMVGTAEATHSATYFVSNLTPGPNTFTMKYRIGFSGTMTAYDRSIIVEPV